jgi:RNA polymerase sigma-70 factor (ECF subfamily)
MRPPEPADGVFPAVPSDWQHLFSKYRPLLHAQVLKILGPRAVLGETASDVVQEGLQRASMSLQTCQGTGEKQRWGWLRKVVRHVAIDTARKRGAKFRARTAGRLEHPSEEPARGRSPLEELMHTEEALRISEALTRLSEVDRQIITLRFLHRLSLNEIADMLEKTRVAVSKAQERALEHLRKELAQMHRPGEASDERAPASAR